MMDLSYPAAAPASRRTATHIYILPHPGLRALVAHYTLCLRSPAGADHGEVLTLLPDASGCLVFDLTPAGLAGRVFGPSTRAATVVNDLGRNPFRFFVECRPGGLYPLLDAPLWELKDRVVPLGALVAPLEREVGAAFEGAADLPDFIRRVDGVLLARAGADNPALPLLRALERGARLEDSGWSLRHLSRLLRRGAGLGRKELQRVARVNAAARALGAGTVSLTRLAQDLGYYDQAHFIHEFSAVVGLPPGAYRQNLADFYKEPYKL